VFREIDETKKIYNQRTGAQLDIEALADEVEADEVDESEFNENKQNSIEFMWVSNPLLM